MRKDKMKKKGKRDNMEEDEIKRQQTMYRIVEREVCFST